MKLDIGESDARRPDHAVPQVQRRSRALYPSPTLTAAAEEQVAFLRDNDLFSHIGTTRRTPARRERRRTYPGTFVGENLARGTTSASGALVRVEGLARSTTPTCSHPAWNAIGIAKVTTTHGTLWAVVFGDVVDCPEPPARPRSSRAAAPTPSSLRTRPTRRSRFSAGTMQRSGSRRQCLVLVSAFTVLNATPSTGATVTITNRSSGERAARLR